MKTLSLHRGSATLTRRKIVDNAMSGNGKPLSCLNPLDPNFFCHWEKDFRILRSLICIFSHDFFFFNYFPVLQENVYYDRYYLTLRRFSKENLHHSGREWEENSMYTYVYDGVKEILRSILGHCASLECYCEICIIWNKFVVLNFCVCHEIKGLRAAPSAMAMSVFTKCIDNGNSRRY